MAAATSEGSSIRTMTSDRSTTGRRRCRRFRGAGRDGLVRRGCVLAPGSACRGDQRVAFHRGDGRQRFFDGAGSDAGSEVRRDQRVVVPDAVTVESGSVPATAFRR